MRTILMDKKLYDKIKHSSFTFFREVFISISVNRSIILYSKVQLVGGTYVISISSVDVQSWMKNNGKGLLSQDSVRHPVSHAVTQPYLVTKKPTQFSQIAFLLKVQMLKKNNWDQIQESFYAACTFLRVFVSAHSDFGGFIESGDPVDEILLVVGLQKELPHPSVDDWVATTDRREKLSGNSLKGKWLACLISHTGLNMNHGWAPSTVQHVQCSWC